MPLSTEAEAALVQWVNTFSLQTEVESLADLNDGLVLSQMMGEIDSSFRPSATTGSDSLQAVVQDLFQYIRIECEGLDALLESPSLKHIVEDGNRGFMDEVGPMKTKGKKVISTNFLHKLLAVMLMAAISGPERQTFVMKITHLEENVAAQIAEIIKQKQKEVEEWRPYPTTSNPPEAPTSPATDLELEFEERYATLISEKRKLEQERGRLRKEVADYTTRISRLQDNNTVLQERLRSAEDQAEKSAGDDETVKKLKSLESKIYEQNELIASQEAQIEQDRMDRQRLRKDNERLLKAHEKAQQLEDDLKEIKHQNLELSKKANTADRFKQKLEAQRDFQAEVEHLELENEELRQQLRELEVQKQRNAILEATHQRYQETLSKLEMEIFELSAQKKTIDDEKVSLQRELAILQERRANDETFIAELQDQLQGKPANVSPRSTMGNLEDELAETSSTGPRNNLEISRLKAEIQLLKGNAAAAAENNVLRAQREAAEQRLKEMEAKFRQAYDEKIIAINQVKAVMDVSTDEGLVKGVNAAMLIGKLEILTIEYYRAEAIRNLRSAQHEAATEVSAAKKRLLDVEGELEATKRELLVAKTDLSMIAKEDIDALEELKSTQETLTSSFETELKALQVRYKSLEADHDLQKSQLIEALLAKDKLREQRAENAQIAAYLKDTDEEPEVPVEPKEPEESKHEESEMKTWENIMALQAVSEDLSYESNIVQMKEEKQGVTKDEAVETLKRRSGSHQAARSNFLSVMKLPWGKKRSSSKVATPQSNATKRSASVGLAPIASSTNALAPRRNIPLSTYVEPALGAAPAPLTTVNPPRIIETSAAPSPPPTPRTPTLTLPAKPRPKVEGRSLTNR